MQTQRAKTDSDTIAKRYATFTDKQKKEIKTLEQTIVATNESPAPPDSRKI